MPAALHQPILPGSHRSFPFSRFPFQIPSPLSPFAPPNLDGESMTASWASGGGGCGEKSGGDRKLGRTLGPGSRWGGFSGTGGSGGGSSGTGDGGFVGGGGPGEPTARVSSVLHFGGKKVSSLPLFFTSQHYLPQFLTCAPNKLHLCGHQETPGGRVCIDADNFGSALGGCVFEVSLLSMIFKLVLLLRSSCKKVQCLTLAVTSSVIN